MPARRSPIRFRAILCLPRAAGRQRPASAVRPWDALSDYAPSGAEIDTYDNGTDGQATGSLDAVGTASHSAGFDSLFGSTSSASASTKAPASSVGVGSRTAASGQTGAAYDPYQAYEGAGAARHTPTRNVVVINPVAYGEVEEVARHLKAGDAVVLSLRNTPSQLSKRILDFSFGVASALDASVDCIADKVFAITRGSALSDAENLKLRGQGVI